MTAPTPKPPWRDAELTNLIIALQVAWDEDHRSSATLAWIEHVAAKSELTALRAERDRLRAALENIVKHQAIAGGEMAAFSATYQIARAALAATKEETKP